MAHLCHLVVTFSTWVPGPRFAPTAMLQSLDEVMMDIGGIVTIGRTCSHTCIHLAILRICDTRALDAADRGTLTAWYGLLFMDAIALCLYDTCCVCMIRVVLWLMYA
jgi:hypothetical protein